MSEITEATIHQQGIQGHRFSILPMLKEAVLDGGVAWALDAGARLADFQLQEHVRVMLDPVGHPFYLLPGPV